jgi:putative copper export protein
MRRPLGLLPTGQYLVRWTSVSAIDGHTLRGSYTFAVGTSANPATSIADSPLDSEGPLGLVGRFVELVALGTWLAWALLGRPSRQAELDPTRVRRVGRWAPMLAFGGALVSLVSMTVVATGSLSAIGAVLASQSGGARLVVLAVTSIGVLVGPRLPLVAAVFATIAIIAEAASGHAASSVLPPVAIVSFSLHLAAVGVWIYAIGASVFAAPHVQRALGTFTPYAVGAAVLTAGTGLANAIIELSDPADVIGTGYGLTLLAKSAAFVLMASFGLIHFALRRRPDIDEPTLRGPIRAEATAATVALILATLLVGFPNPPREAEATTAELTRTDPVLADLGQREALSIADASGPFIVGLTILPPRPGRAEIRIQVVGVNPGDGLRNARFSAASGASSVQAPLGRDCGFGCFAGDATFPSAGEWQLKVDVESNRGPISIAAAVPLPTPDGSGALARTLVAEEALKSVVMTETLRGSAGGPPYVSTYRLEAPDRADITLKDSTEILIGEQGFRRTGTGAWEKFSVPAPGFSWPTGYYSDFWQGAVATRIIGSETIDGVPSLIIAFVRPDVPAWFRVWVSQSDGIIQQEQMRAEGHLMDHTFADLNGPIRVQAPP